MNACDYMCIHVEHTLSLHHSDGAQGMSIDDSELREYTHGLFGSMAAILKQDFQPFLATCVAAALASCNQVSHPLHQKVVTYLATHSLTHAPACRHASRLSHALRYKLHTHTCRPADMHACTGTPAHMHILNHGKLLLR